MSCEQIFEQLCYCTLSWKVLYLPSEGVDGRRRISPIAGMRREQGKSRMSVFNVFRTLM